MEWTGLEWNGMERGKQLSINAHAHTVPYTISLKSDGCLDSVDWNDGMERWNGLDWNGMEWNAESN